jgi:hypothetical protein
MLNNDANPMQRAHCSPRCTATAKSTKLRCRAPAVTGWSVCRMHGARGGASLGVLHPNFKHGLRGKEFAELRSLSIGLRKFSACE